jgi:hypothetical protein
MKTSKGPRSVTAYISMPNIKLWKHFVKWTQQLNMQLLGKAFRLRFAKRNRGLLPLILLQKGFKEVVWGISCLRTEYLLKNLPISHIL